MIVKELIENKTFVPVKLEVTIETFEELCALWHRLNAASSAVKESFDPEDGVEWRDASMTKLWDMVDNAITIRQ